MLPLLEIEIEIRQTKDGRPLVRIAFAGVGGDGSDGNHHGVQMRDAVRQVVEREAPCGLIIDLRHLDYQFGNWIGMVVQPRCFSGCRTCMVAEERTLECLRPLWEVCGLGNIVALLETLAQAEEFVRSAE